MTYTGEHLLPGQLGHLASVISLIVSLVATIAFYKSNKATLLEEKRSWLKMARTAFIIEVIAVIVTICCLYYILSHHLFEYFFAWEHSDKTLQPEYILSCLWEGQEGSFLLWTFWNCVLGCVLMWRAKEREAPVMTVISFAQFCLATMILGLYVFNLKIGSDPFLLMRQKGILDNAPIFLDQATGGFRKDYLQFLRDGQGLNATLQNYWMVIHPPILFLGFSSTIVPFAYAYAGLINKENGWTKHSIAWAAFSGGVLGLGISMGAAWAYESLNFGGYWAWDPVENASIVPWLVMVAGLHTNLVYKHSKYSLKITYIFYILSFCLVLYSTYLTRSGVLGDTSVHSFTGADMDIQLISFILVFFIPAIILFVLRRKQMPSVQQEESLYSREFWMFIGSLVLFLGGLIIIGKTSVPVFNKIFGTRIAAPEDVLFSYNQLQIFIAIVVGFLTAFGQYLKYKNTSRSYLHQKLLTPTFISLIITGVFFVAAKINYRDHGTGFLIAVYIAVFAAVYAILANIGYIFLVLRGKIKTAGASVAHIGFGLVLFGILLSSAKKKIISNNTTGINLMEKSKDYDPAENITLFKNIPIDMGDYMVTYQNDTMNQRDRHRVFTIHFEDKQTKKSFNIYPYILKNNRQVDGYGATPDSKHFWNKDIYGFVSAYPQANENADTASFRPASLKVGDTIFYSRGMLILNKVDVNKPTASIPKIDSGEMLMSLDMTVVSKEGSRFLATPSVLVKENSAEAIPDTVMSQGLVIKFNRVLNDQNGNLEIGVKESDTLNTAITMKVIVFPFVTVLWIGIIVMVIGFWMSVYQRVRKLTASSVAKS